MPLYIAQSGDLDRCHACLTHSLTTLKDRATQLLIKYKSGALVTQCMVLIVNIGNISAWLMWRGRLCTLKQVNFGVCSHFFSVSPKTTCNCVVGFLKKCLQYPFAPTLLRRACTRVSPFTVKRKVVVGTVLGRGHEIAHT